MTAISRQIADALVTALQNAGFSEAERRPLPYTEREQCPGRKCVVSVRNQQYLDGSREGYDQMVELAIALQKAADSQDNTTVDPLLDDVATLVGLWGDGGALHDQQLAGADYAEGPEHPTGNVYEPVQLHELQLFTSIITVRYQSER